MDLQNKIIRQPLISEKGTDLSASDKYIFLVNPEANKKQIAEAIEKIYKIHVEKVNVIRNRKKANEYKKAVVTIKAGETIDVIPH
ncbi:MAG: 50S ribosomal protein L23 [bacterium]|nr:50S ribosomal protein L23 [bacterium]MDZ4231351.1 50S ribosomal protein L23 [Patescibacteria group bacterium]